MAGERREAGWAFESRLCNIHGQIIETDRKYISPTPPPQFTLLFSGGGGGVPPCETKYSGALLLLSTCPRVICNVDLKSRTIAQKSGKSNAEAPYFGSKVSSWMQLVNSVPWTFVVYFP